MSNLTALERLTLTSIGGKTVTVEFDADRELVVGIRDGDSYDDFMLTVADVEKLREWFRQAMSFDDLLRERNIPSKDESLARIVEVLAAAKHITEVAARGHSYYITENGRHPGSGGPWAELINAVRALESSPETTGDALDAARYRWLRDGSMGDSTIHYELCQDLANYNYGATDVDRKFDNAMAASPVKSNEQPSAPASPPLSKSASSTDEAGAGLTISRPPQ